MRWYGFRLAVINFCVIEVCEDLRYITVKIRYFSLHFTLLFAKFKNGRVLCPQPAAARWGQRALPVGVNRAARWGNAP